MNVNLFSLVFICLIILLISSYLWWMHSIFISYFLVILIPTHMRAYEYIYICRSASPLPTSVLGMTLHCIWWWGYSPGALGMWSASSLPLPPGLVWPGLVVSVRIPSMNQIEFFNLLLWIIIIIIIIYLFETIELCVNYFYWKEYLINGITNVK